MKKVYFLSILAAAALTACSSDEPASTGGETATNHYMAINIVPTAASPSSKAAGDQVAGKPDGADYEEGYKNENAVKNVRFYFFNATGNAAVINRGNGKNYIEWTAEESTDQDMPNVEKMLKATIILSTPEDATFPTQMLTVVNPQSAVLGNESLDLGTLTALTDNHVARTASEYGFVMATSVYAATAGTAGTEKVTTPITEANFATSEAAALANPVNVYVERNVAKVRVFFAESANATQVAGTNDMKVKVGTISENGTDKDVYAIFSAWNLTATTEKSYVSKHINSGWASTLFSASEPWNYSPYFRSFWAINSADAGQNYFKYEEIAPTGKPVKYTAQAVEDGATDENIIYTEENAADATDGTLQRTYPTKVMLKAQLVDNEGNYIELCKWMGKQLTGEAALKTAMLEYMETTGNMIYAKTVNGTDVSFASLTADDVKFVTSTAAGVAQTGEANKGRYFVYLQLSDTGKAKTWVGAEDKDAAVITDVDKLLRDTLDHASIAKTGDVYYYFTVEHLGADGNPGKYGIVRNHIYSCGISEVKGFGTPVYDPTEVIYPEKPQDDETYVAAKVKILSWRVVASSVPLDWQ